MTRSHRSESAREEAERLDALEEEGVLDELPFRSLRRYAKEPSQVYAIRIPVSRLEAIRRLAERRDEQPTALLREWVLERLDEELAGTDVSRVKATAAPYRVAKASGDKAVRPKRAAAKKAAAKKAAAKKAAKRR